MMDDNRINRRSRPRPYDLRRKVLLKNFLREQMTHIPLPDTRIESVSQSNNVVSEDDSSVDIHLDEELNKDLWSLPTTVNEQSSPGKCDNTDSYPVVKDIKGGTSDNIDIPVDANLSCDSTEGSSLFKFTSLVKFKRESKKKLKGIFKAKDMCKTVKSPVKSRSFKSGLERLLPGRKTSSESKYSNQTSRNSHKSLFSHFKRRKEQRNLRTVDGIKRSYYYYNNVETSRYNTINQSVQTDDSWTRQELARVQQSNRFLKEENRLLSESLSYFMSNTTMDPQVKHCNTPLQSCNNLNNTVFPDYYVPPSNSSNASWNTRRRVTRSNSVQEYNKRENISRNVYRTRSMSYHSYQSNRSSNIKSSVAAHNEQSQGINPPRFGRKNGFNFPLNDNIRSIQRRSSMPERILSENDRTVVYRRSGSFRYGHNGKPFNSLSSEAFY